MPIHEGLTPFKGGTSHQKVWEGKPKVFRDAAGTEGISAEKKVFFIGLTPIPSGEIFDASRKKSVIKRRTRQTRNIKLYKIGTNNH